MTAQADPYSRVYWRIRDEFPDLYANKEAFGWWMALLMIAEGAHPSAPELPRKVKPSILTFLTDQGVLTLLPGDRYRVRGVAAEMERRSSRGNAGASARWMRTQSEGNANALRPQSLDETRRAKTRRDETSIPRVALEEAKPWVTLTPEERADADRAEKDEAIRRTMLQVGLKPEPVA